MGLESHVIVLPHRSDMTSSREGDSKYRYVGWLTRGTERALATTFIVIWYSSPWTQVVKKWPSDIVEWKNTLE